MITLYSTYNCKTGSFCVLSFTVLPIAGYFRLHSMQAVLNSDIYAADKSTISAEKIIYKIWDHRKSPEQIQFYTDILTCVACYVDLSDT